MRRHNKENMALIVYTGGSTGAPKGFWITHTFVGAVNLPGHRFSDDDDGVIYPSPHVGIHFLFKLIMMISALNLVKAQPPRRGR